MGDHEPPVSVSYWQDTQGLFPNAWTLDFHTAIEGEPMNENDEQENGREATPAEELADDVETAARHIIGIEYLIKDWLTTFVVCALISTGCLLAIALKICLDVF